MGQARVRKLAGLPPRTKATPKATPTFIPPPLQWYAEYSAQLLEDHNAHCTDPACTDDIKIFYKEVRLVAMVKSHEPKKLYIAPFGTDSPIDYKPMYVLNLETGEEIAGSFEADGSVHCSVTGHNHDDRPICLTLLCHRAGVALVVHKDAPDTVSVICADPSCGNAIKSGENLLTRRMKLAKQPVAEYPNVFCKHHGVQPRYLACIHVAHGEKEPMILNRPTATDVGLAFCSDECSDELDRETERNKAGDKTPSPLIHVICAAHLNDHQDGKLERYHQQAEANREPQEATA